MDSLRQNKNKMIIGPFYTSSAEMLRFCDNYPGVPHIAAPTWPYTYLLLFVPQLIMCA